MMFSVGGVRRQKWQHILGGGGPGGGAGIFAGDPGFVGEVGVDIAAMHVRLRLHSAIAL